AEPDEHDAEGAPVDDPRSLIVRVDFIRGAALAGDAEEILVRKRCMALFGLPLELAVGDGLLPVRVGAADVAAPLVAVLHLPDLFRRQVAVDRASGVERERLAGGLDARFPERGASRAEDGKNCAGAIHRIFLWWGERGE